MSDPRTDALARAVDTFGRAWHAYDLVGAERIPRDRASIVVLYHGFMPLDGWFFLARMYLEHGLHIRALTDRWLLATPGLRRLVDIGQAVSADPDEGLRLLSQGHTLLVAPGGTREAIKGKPRHYQVTWGQRVGFARLALRANVPLIPIFGENVEEIFRSPFVHARPFQAFYERTRWPIVPLAGLGPLPFPVKVRTWVGQPVEPRPDDTPEILRDRVRDELQALIDAHQGGRPRLLRGLLARARGAERVSPVRGRGPSLS
jgi:1-acyl-sn-glycerol-3-phosphate acyltransferase